MYQNIENIIPVRGEVYITIKTFAMNYKFEKRARINKVKAFSLTVALHVILIGGISMYGDGNASDLIPQKIKTFLGMEKEAMEDVAVTTRKKTTALP